MMDSHKYTNINGLESILNANHIYIHTYISYDIRIPSTILRMFNYIRYVPCADKSPTHPPLSSLVASIDKRQLLRHLKSVCTRDFLVTHTLHG